MMLHCIPVARRVRGGCISASMLLALFVSMPASAVEARSFVLNWLALAVNQSDEDCRNVPLGSPGVIARQSLVLQGHSEQEADRLAEEFKLTLLTSQQELTSGYGETEQKYGDFTTRRGRIAGEPVDAYLNPSAAPNPKIPPMAGRLQYGFDLDGRGTDSENSIEDPETHERGIDNEYARAVGCMTPFRNKTNMGSAPDTGNLWGEGRPASRASLITVMGEDLSKNGEVIVLIRRSLDPPLVNSKGEAQADATFRLDQDPRMLNIFRGRMENGVVTSMEPIDFYLMNFHDYRLLQARLRLELKVDGTAVGMLGGYRPWTDIYAVFSTGGIGWEFMSTLNVVGLFYNLRDYADAYPDENGQNTAISSAYKFEAVPAYIVGADGYAETLQPLQAYRTILPVQSQAHRADILRRN